MPKRGKKYVAAAKTARLARQYSPIEALDLVKTLAHASFDETVELAVRLGIDPRKADQVLRGTVSLPAGTGKSVRVAVFAAGEAAEAARAAGADFVGSDDLVARVDGGFMDFDVAIATPDLMGQVGRLGRKLGPGASCPTPRPAPSPPTWAGRWPSSRVAVSSTGPMPAAVAWSRCRSARSASRRDKLLTNFRAVLDELQRVKPAAAKGRYVKAVAVSSTMGPGHRRRPGPPAGHRRGAGRRRRRLTGWAGTGPPAGPSDRYNGRADITP